MVYSTRLNQFLISTHRAKINNSQKKFKIPEQDLICSIYKMCVGLCLCQGHLWPVHVGSLETTKQQNVGIEVASRERNLCSA